MQAGHQEVEKHSKIDLARSPLDDHTPSAIHTLVLALGANSGDRRANLLAALQQLRTVMKIEMLSSIYETMPVGFRDQPQFLNMVCLGETSLEAAQVLTRTQAIEVALGRTPSFRNAPRPIDIDILFYDSLCLDQTNLTIPHPRLRERAFVLVPLAEIIPTFTDPVSKQTVQELLNAIPQEGVTRLPAHLQISLKHARERNSTTDAPDTQPAGTQASSSPNAAQTS